ncbi:MAG: hypothetical protein JWM30_3444 [Burkholderia sp.]|nr:hypothetical protein [Burkholderia sp.]
MVGAKVARRHIRNGIDNEKSQDKRYKVMEFQYVGKNKQQEQAKQRRDAADHAESKEFTIIHKLSFLCVPDRIIFFKPFTRQKKNKGKKDDFYPDYDRGGSRNSQVNRVFHSS